MGDSINNMIDNLVAVCWRLLELPTYALLIGTVVLLLFVNLAARRWTRRINQNKLRWTNIILGALLLVFIIDKKFYLMRSEVTAMQERMNELRMVEGAGLQEGKRDISALLESFPEFKVFQRNIDDVAELIVIQSEVPKAVAYIAIVDLTYPTIQVHITPEKKEKYLTSTFAIESGSYIAVNGEAGETMDLDAPLGKFTGNWVDDGNVVMMTDGDRRPFMSFTKENQAHYSPAIEVDTVMGPDKHNALWGRWDILLEGQIKGVIFEEQVDKHYARTIMGLDESGETLYLMVVDGKRPDYSIGFKYRECAQILSDLGAFNVMACDQGGSSCMYVRQLGGIINRPADSDGYERPVYSHFGISW